MVLCILVTSVPLTAYAQQDNGSSQETAVAVAPAHLALDGSKAYVIFTACVWGGHTYGIGLDATATADLGKADKYATPGSVITLPQAGLGWTLTQTSEGLVIANQGRYLTVSGDQKSLVVSARKTASGLTIMPNGMLALAGSATKTVYLQEGDNEPNPGQRFGITDKANKTVFYFAEIQDSQPSADVLFPTLLPLKNFRAKIVSPDAVYGDDQYVIFTMNAGRAIAITSSAGCSSPLKLDKEPAAGVTLTSPDQNTLWTVNNNRSKSAPSGYYKYIRSCASNKYLAANPSLLDENIQCDFYLADKDGNSALIATAKGEYVTLNGNAFTTTSDRNAASRFYFAKLLMAEQQTAGSTTAIPQGNLMRLVDWADIETGKTYAIISATELNKMHYALSGNGRLARYGADNLTNNSLCPNEHVNGVYGAPCKAAKGDIFYTNGQDILWTASISGKNQAVFKNITTNLYLKPSQGVAAGQTPSISTSPATITIEPVSGQVYAYLHEGSQYLGIWQYVSVGVGKNADERCAYYLAEVLDTNDIKDLPATALEKDWDQSTVSFGGLYSIYQGSQHLLNDATGVENFILMDDGTGRFKPSSAEYKGDGKDNYYVTYCADWEAEMPSFTDPGQYKAVSLEDYEGFSAAQKAALGAVIPRCYPYVTKDEFLASLKKAGYKVSADCGTDEIMAGIQAVIYNITNPRPDGESWGYESSEGWAHNSYEVNKPASYVSDPAQAERDVNAVRDYLWSFVKPAVNAKKVVSRAAKANSETTEQESKYFAITTDITTVVTTEDGEQKTVTHTWALSYPYSYGDSFALAPYNADDIRQMWCKDEHGSLQWVPYILNYGEKGGQTPCLSFFKSSGSDSRSFSWGEYYLESESYHCYGHIPLTLDETNGRLKLNDYEKKLSTVTQWKADELLSISIDQWYLDREEWYYEDGRPMELDVHSIFAQGPEGLTFTKKEATPRFPDLLDYDIKDSEWKVTDNGNGTYNVTVSGHLNLPARDEVDYIGVIISPDSEFPADYNGYEKWYMVTPGKDEFTFTVDNIPDLEEVHFCLRIIEVFPRIKVFMPEKPGQQVQIGWVVDYASKEIHEQTTSITAKKAWADEEDHSKDKVELCLVENGKETSRKITLSADNDWQGKFKHVPYKRWMYTGYGPDPYVDYTEIPLESHQYTVKELNVKPGYAPIYTIEEPDESEELDKLKPGKSYPVQAVYTTDNGKELTIRPFEGVVEYIKGDKNQRYFLNGNGSLVLKFENEEIPFPVYFPLGFEQANVEGKYYLYENVPDEDIPGGKVYLQLTDTDVDGTLDKSQATAFELRNFETGEVLTTLPTDVFQPFETTFEVYENGQVTESVLDFREGFNEYDPDNPYQKFTIYSCDGQLIALIDGVYEMFIQLEPCQGVNGQYLLRTIFDPDEPPVYLGKDKDSGRLIPVQTAGEATRFGLKGIPTNDLGAMGKYFKVTNASGASLEVSKTVSGAGVDQNKAFTFTVTLGDQTINGTFGGMTFQNGVATFTLKHGQKKTATGLPGGITYEVAETDNAGYTVTVNGGSAVNGKVTGNLVAGEPVTLAFNNGKPSAVPQTGDPMNTALWLAMLAISALVLVTLSASRKKKESGAR